MAAPIAISPVSVVKDTPASGRGVYATALIPAGTEILIIDDPLLCMPENNMLDTFCNYCLAEETTVSEDSDGSVPFSQSYKDPVKLSYCLGCKIVKYCGKACQTADWKQKGHSYECKIYKAQAPRILPTAARAILRLAKLFLSETISANKLGGVGALMSQTAAIQASGGERWEMANLIAKGASAFSKESKKESFEPEFLRDLYCKLITNSATASTQTFDSVGICIDYKMAMFNHSCDPNAVMVFDGRKLTFRSLREISMDEEICMTYIDLGSTRKQRRAELKERYFFDCECSLCQSPNQPLESTICANSKCKNLIPSSATTCPSCSSPISKDLPAAISLAESISEKWSHPDTDKSISQGLKYLQQLYATNLLPPAYPPIAQIHQDLAPEYTNLRGDYATGIRHLFVLFTKVAPTFWSQPFHPVRVMRTLTLAMNVIHVATDTVGVEKFKSVGFDWHKLLYALMVEVVGNVEKSHGGESSFARQVRGKMKEVEVDVGIDSNYGSKGWTGKGLKGVEGLDKEIRKMEVVVEGFVGELRAGRG